MALAFLAGACAPSSPSPRMARDTDPSYLHSAVGGGAGAGYAERVSVAADSEAGTDVTLAVILAYADRHSPVLSVARSTRSRAEAARVGASTLLPANPEVSVAVGPRVGAAGTGVDVDLGLMQQIQIAGERGLRVEVADRLRDLSDAEIGQMSWSVRCDVHEAFHRALFEQERARLAERVLGFQREVLRVVERQISAGEAAPFSLRLAQAEVAQAQQMLVAAQQAFVASRLRLAQLSGWPVATPPMPVGSVDSSRDPPSLARLSAMAGERLPSLRAGVARVREAEARAALADREVWPRPSVGVQYRREGGMGTEGTTHVMMGAVSFPIPAFQKNQGERAMARADIAVAEAELRAARHLLEGQIAEARSEVVAAAERTRAYGSDILPLFEENLTMLRRSFELGEIDILALSTGRERLFSIQSDAILAQQDYFVALARLERIIGVDLSREHHNEEGVP